jgi:ubiquinone biosynthesis protein UbiJ
MQLSLPSIAVLNHLLAQAEWARNRLRPFAGRRASLVAQPLVMKFSIGDDGDVLAMDTPGEPDVSIELPALTPWRLLGGRQAMFAGAHVSGAADFAEALGFVLRNLRWDVEEDLSRVVGDVTAHRIAGMLDSFIAWNRQAASNAADNLFEYLAEEQPALLKGNDAKELSAELAALGRDLSQLELRIERLTHKK